MYHIIIHSSVDGHLGCFYILAIVGSATLNIEVHVFFELEFCLGTCPGVGLPDHKAGLILIFDEPPNLPLTILII